jgi:PTH1 family peptidyl-tRNA hydrolase
LGTQNFPRLRIGIGKPRSAATDSDTVSHVLGKFAPRENELISEVLYLVRDAIELSLKEGVEKAMSLYNGRSIVGSHS